MLGIGTFDLPCAGCGRSLRFDPRKAGWIRERLDTAFPGVMCAAGASTAPKAVATNLSRELLNPACPLE